MRKSLLARHVSAAFASFEGEVQRRGICSAYTFVDPIAGAPPITDHVIPATVETVGSTVITNKPVPLGTIRRAVDPTYGEGEFIRLVGVASTVVGMVVKYNTTTWQTALLSVANGKNKGEPVAVAMSACVANEHGWYQIGGLAVIKKTTVAASPSVPIFISATDGRIKVLASAGQQILSAQTANLATVVTTTSTVVVAINRPMTQGQIT